MGGQVSGGRTRSARSTRNPGPIDRSHVQLVRKLFIINILQRTARPEWTATRASHRGPRVLKYRQRASRVLTPLCRKGGTRERKPKAAWVEIRLKMTLVYNGASNSFGRFGLPRRPGA